MFICLHSIFKSMILNKWKSHVSDLLSKIACFAIFIDRPCLTARQTWVNLWEQMNSRFIAFQLFWSRGNIFLLNFLFSFLFLIFSFISFLFIFTRAFIGKRRKKKWKSWSLFPGHLWMFFKILTLHVWWIVAENVCRLKI